MDERIIEVVKDQSKGAPSTTSMDGGFRRVGPDKVQYDLFFTNKRIIAATVFSQSDISNYEAKAWIQSLPMVWKKTREKRRQEFEGKTPDELLHLHKDSFELPYDKVKSIRMKKNLIGVKLIAEFDLEGEIQSVDLKIPKKMVQQVETLINTYIPFVKDNSSWEKSPPNFVLERKKKKYLFLFALAIVGCIIVIWPISGFLVEINFYLSIIVSFALFIIFATAAPIFLKRYWNQNQ